ncbi:MAG: hypothetical protein ACLP2P_04705 [Desulfobaccales bacterium]
MNVWELTILKIIMSIGGKAGLQQIYRSLENGTFMTLTEDHLRETQWQRRPAYQHQVRSHVSNMAQAGDLLKVSTGVYAITDKGRQRIVD